MSAEPLVSICIPAYNVEAVIAEALTSVLVQTYRNLEIIVVDDGSRDRTFEIIQSFQDPRLRCIRNTTNLGGFQTMNKAVNLSQGEFVAVYHSDDIYTPLIVEKEVTYLQSHPSAGAVFCLDHFIDAVGQVYGGATLPREFQGQDLLTYEAVFPFLLRRKNILFCCPTFMSRRCVLDQVGLFDPDRFDIAADLDLWIRIVRQFPVGILNERLMYYRHSREQWSSRYKRLRTTPERFFAIADHYLEVDRWAEKLQSQDWIEYDFQRCDDETTRAANCIIQGETKQAQELLLERPYPWKTLLNQVRRRKLRVLLLRWLLVSGLSLGLVRPLAKLLVWTEYGGHI